MVAFLPSSRFPSPSSPLPTRSGLGFPSPLNASQPRLPVPPLKPCLLLHLTEAPPRCRTFRLSCCSLPRGKLPLPSPHPRPLLVNPSEQRRTLSNSHSSSHAPHHPRHTATEPRASAVCSAKVSFTVTDFSEQNTLVSFSETDIRRRSFESISQKRPVSINIATLSSFEEGELLTDGGISKGRFVLEREEVEELMASTGRPRAWAQLAVRSMGPSSGGRAMGMGQVAGRVEERGETELSRAVVFLWGERGRRQGSGSRGGSKTEEQATRRRADSTEEGDKRGIDAKSVDRTGGRNLGGSRWLAWVREPGSGHSAGGGGQGGRGRGREGNEKGRAAEYVLSLRVDEEACESAAHIQAATPRSDCQRV